MNLDSMHVARAKLSLVQQTRHPDSGFGCLQCPEHGGDTLMHANHMFVEIIKNEINILKINDFVIY